MSSLPPKQLAMVFDAAAVGRLPDVAPPDGYVSRTYRPGDAASWADTLQAGGFEEWNEARVEEFLEVEERREGSSLIEHQGRIVAATFASRISNRPPTIGVSGADPSEEGMIDYVVTHPEHRGKGLGRVTCTEVAGSSWRGDARPSPLTRTTAGCRRYISTCPWGCHRS